MLTVGPSLERLRVIGYLRVSTQDQSDTGYGLAAQRQALLAEVERREWQLVELVEDSVSGKDLKRPALQRALGRLSRLEADALVVAKLDRLTRSIGDFVQLLGQAGREGWAVVALDLALDTSTPSGEAMANMTAVFAQLERKLISQRTREALAVARSRGVRLGRAPEVAAELEARIVRERGEGASMQAIADRLNAEGVSPARGGGRWYSSTVHRVLARHPELAPSKPGRRPKIATG